MKNRVRVRFAPSPTGPLHIGGVRTALFNYLFAKKEGGDFVLRIEDTDQNRFVAGAEEYIVEALNWCGIPFDEGPGKEGEYGPYRQSERKHLYKKYADELLKNGFAYYAFDTSGELDSHRKDHEAKGKTFIYNWHNRNKLKNSLSMSSVEVQNRIENGEAHVIRFKSPENEQLVLHDIVRGEITIDTSTLDDKVLFKSDGMPTYHLANIVDDHLMEISHVIRGEEWLPSLALHILLYRSFDWVPPKFAHLPLILKPTGKGKLSKRDGDKMGFPVFPLEWIDLKTNEVSPGYRETGYFPQTVVNFLVMLGWNPGTEQEIFDLSMLVQLFDLERVNKSGARFDLDKTKWYNHHYLQEASNSELASLFAPILLEKGIKASAGYIEEVVSLIKERASFVSEFWELGAFFFKAPASYDVKATKKQWKPDTSEILKQVMELLRSEDDFTAIQTESVVKEWVGNNGLGFGKVMPPLRLALVGAMKGPHIFEIMQLIGKKETLSRLDNAIKSLS